MMSLGRPAASAKTRMAPPAAAARRSSWSSERRRRRGFFGTAIGCWPRRRRRLRGSQGNSTTRRRQGALFRGSCKWCSICRMCRILRICRTVRRELVGGRPSVPPEKTVPEGEAASKGRVGWAMHKSNELIPGSYPASWHPIPITDLSRLGLLIPVRAEPTSRAETNCLPIKHGITCEEEALPLHRKPGTALSEHRSHASFHSPLLDSGQLQFAFDHANKTPHQIGPQTSLQCGWALGDKGRPPTPLRTCLERVRNRARGLPCLEKPR